MVCADQPAEHRDRKYKQRESRRAPTVAAPASEVLSGQQCSTQRKADQETEHETQTDIFCSRMLEWPHHPRTIPGHDDQESYGTAEIGRTFYADRDIGLIGKHSA